MNDNKININSLLEEFVSSNLSPTESERKEVSAKYDELSSILKGRNFISGSYGRFTSITPLHDVDVIWELPEETVTNNIRKSISLKVSPDELDVKNILGSLAKRLREEYEKLGVKVNVLSETHSVTIEFLNSSHEFTIDVVPAVPITEKNEFGLPLYIVPEIIKDSHRVRKDKYSSKEPIIWIKTDPEGYIEEASKANEENQSFRKSVKFLKGWRRKSKEGDVNFKLKSFHIEQYVLHFLRENHQKNTWEVVTTFFDDVEQIISSPQIPDRANDTVFIDAYISELTEDETRLILTNAQLATNLLNKIEQAQSESEVKEYLQEISLIQKTNKNTIYPITKDHAPTKPWYSGDFR